jgi:hypothetical protein
MYHLNRIIGLVGFTLLILPNSVLAARLTADQKVITEILQDGQYIYPVIESGSLAGEVAVFEEPGVAFVNSPGFFRSLLKGVTVVAGGVTGAAIGSLVAPGPGTAGGAATGALAAATVVNNINREGPGPGKKWLISDIRAYESINVSGVGEILPDVLIDVSDHITVTTALSSSIDLSFVDTSIFPVNVVDEMLMPISDIQSAGLFVLTNNTGTQPTKFLGSFVLNEIGSVDSRPLTETDFLDIELGSSLSVADGTEITSLSTLVVGFKSVPEPTSILSFLAFGTLGAASTLKRKLNLSKSADKELEKVS